MELEVAGQGHNGGSLYIRRGPYYAGGGGAGGAGGSNFGGSITGTVVLGGGAGITSGITGTRYRIWSWSRK